MISSLCSFLSADSESAMIINKTNFSYLLQAISVLVEKRLRKEKVEKRLEENMIKLVKLLKKSVIYKFV